MIASPVMKTGSRFGFAATFLAVTLLAGPARAEDKVLAKVNGSEIRQSDVAMAEEELGPSLGQMDPATKDDVQAALQRVDDGAQFGKVVLSISD